MKYTYTRFVISEPVLAEVSAWAIDSRNQAQLQAHRLGDEQQWQVCIHDIVEPKSYATNKSQEFSQLFGLEALA